MPDLENIDLDLLDHVTGGCGGNSQPASNPNPAPVTDATAPGRAAGFGFFGHVERSHAEVFGAAHVGLGALAGAHASAAALDARDTAAAPGATSSVVCGVVPGADAPGVDLSHGPIDLSPLHGLGQE